MDSESESESEEVGEGGEEEGGSGEEQGVWVSEIPDTHRGS